MNSNLVYLSLGSNIGDKEKNLADAAERIAGLAGVVLLAKSSLYRTEPVGFLEQDWFCNAVLKIATDLPPLALLDRTQEIENDLGRQRLIHWGPRTMDIDILLYNQQVINGPRLQVPHPEIAKRLFVLMPLAELDRQLSIPLSGSLAELLAAHSDRQGIELVQKADQW